MGKKRTPNDNRSIVKNVNNPAYKAARDNWANQLKSNKSSLSAQIKKELEPIYIVNI